MTHASKSIVVFGFYMLGQGLALVFIPNLLLGLFGFPEYSEVWVRVVGFALGVLGYYYVRLGFAGFRPFFSWTVPVRVGQFFFFVALVVLNMLPPMILLFAGTEAAAGIWTAIALRGDGSYDT